MFPVETAAADSRIGFVTKQLFDQESLNKTSLADVNV